MNNNLDRRGFLKAMLVLAGSVVAPGLISAGPRESVYVPSMKPVPLQVHGKAIPYSKEASILSQFDPDDPIHAALRKQMRVSVSRYWRVAADGTGDFRTIQEGVNACRPGDTVVIKAGTYDMARIATPGVRIRGALT